MAFRKWQGLLIGGILTLLCEVGCKTVPHPTSDSLVAVEVHAEEPFNVARTISEVFRSAGYMPLPLDPNNDLRLAFEKASTIADTVLFGGFTSRVWERARLRIQVVGSGVEVIHCDGYRILDHGDRLEEEQKSSTRRSNYYELLNKVKSQLEAAK